MRLRHKTPCSECPWRRASLPGWLGGYEPQQFVQQIQFDGPPLPCHKSFDRSGKANAVCAGAAIFAKNSCKLPATKLGLEAYRQVERDHESVFTRPQEFLDHHTQDLAAWIAARQK